MLVNVKNSQARSQSGRSRASEAGRRDLWEWSSRPQQECVSAICVNVCLIYNFESTTGCHGSEGRNGGDKPIWIIVFQILIPATGNFRIGHIPKTMSCEPVPNDTGMGIGESRNEYDCTVGNLQTLSQTFDSVCIVVEVRMQYSPVISRSFRT